MPAPENPSKPSSRHLVVDRRFALLLGEDFGISTATILDALEDEPQKSAIAICGWAERTDNPAYALRCWARRHGRGAYGTPSVAQGGGRSNTRQHGRASGRTRRDESLRGVLDPARVRANLERMGS